MANPPPNIYIIGAQCTGKTTLVNALLPQLCAAASSRGIDPPALVHEVARTVLREHSFTASDITSSSSRCLQLQQLILSAQDEAETRALTQSSWFVSDRSGVDPQIYAAKYVSDEAAWGMQKSGSWIRIRERMKKGLVVVCEAGAEWLTDDGVRLMPTDRRDWVLLHELFCVFLRAQKLQFWILPCGLADMDGRVRFVVQKWEEMIEEAGQTIAGAGKDLGTENEVVVQQR